MGARALRPARHRPRQGVGQRLRRRRAGAGGRGGRRALEVPRLHRRPHRPPRAQRQLLGPGRAHRPLRALLRALLRLRPRDGLRRPRLQARLRLRPLPRVLEPRVRAVRHGRGRHTSRRCPRAASTPAWGSSASPRITQGVTNVFETDLFVPLVARGAELAGVTPGSSPAVTRALRTMAEHARGAVVPRSWTACCPATTAATTCCGASSAAPCSRPWPSASRSPSSRRSPTRSSSRWAPPTPGSSTRSRRSAAS